MPSLWISCCCLGVISRLSQMKPRLEDSRSRNSLASRSGKVAVSNSTASSTSMILRGSANSDGVRTSVARISPLRSRMSGRAVATASCAVERLPCGAVGHHAEKYQPRRDGGVNEREYHNREPDARARLGVAVDIRAIEQPRDQAVGAPLGEARLQSEPSARLLPRPRCRSGCRSSCSMMAPIGSSISFGRCCKRPRRQLVESVDLGGIDRLQLEMALRQPLDAHRIIELRPFGAQGRDGVALAADFGAQFRKPLGLQRGFRT